MAVYLVKRKNKNKKILKFVYDDCGYEFKPNIHNENLIQITNLYLLDEYSVSRILIKKQEKSFRRLAAIALSVITDEDATTGDALIALDEIARLKNIILKKHKEYLKKEEQDKILKRLKVLENDLKVRLEVLQNEEITHSR